MWVTVFLGDTTGNKRSEYSAYVFPQHPWTQIHLLFHYFFPDSINTDIFIILHVCMTSDFHFETLVKDPRPRSYLLKETGRAHRFNLQMVAWVERTQECGLLALTVTGQSSAWEAQSNLCSGRTQTSVCAFSAFGRPYGRRSWRSQVKSRAYDTDWRRGGMGMCRQTQLRALAPPLTPW